MRLGCARAEPHKCGTPNSEERRSAFWSALAARSGAEYL
jgi:hypothetical protein